MTEKFVPSLQAYHALTEVSELEYLRRRVKQLEDRLLESSWKTNPDRMGGYFSQDEIDKANTWR